MSVRYCSRCVYPAIAATPLTFDENGVCSGCRVALQKDKIDWGRRWHFLKEITDEYRSDEQLRYRDPGQRRQGQLLPDACRRP